jgi:ABC-type amino acid transport system permease subunit
MKNKYNFFNSQEFENLVPYLVLGFIYLAIILILFSL